MAGVAPVSPYSTEIRPLYRSALGIFLITVIIGLINGQKVVELDQAILLTHVHAGTLGWITLNVFAVTMWLFTAGEKATESGRTSVRMLGRAASAAIGCYVLAFFLFYPGIRLSSPLVLGFFGTVAALVIIGFFGWTLGQVNQVRVGVARLAAFGAVTNMTLGAIMGVGIEAKMVGAGLPDGVLGAHPAMMVVGYLIPIGMVVAEWQLRGDVSGNRSVLGTVQVGLPVVGGWLIMVGLLINVIPLVILATLFEIVGAVIFIIRIGPRVVQANWLDGGNARVVGVSSICIVLNVGLLFYLVSTYAGDFAKVPPGLLVALDHIMFIGVMTNALFAAINTATSERADVWAWADQVQFWGMNVGLAGFVVALISNEDHLLMAIFTPIMGISILIAMAAYAMRLRSGQAGALSPAPAM
jgi:hypothetical protein